jgi:hypothetical protein
MIEIKSEVQQCICVECSTPQIVELVYDKIGCNNYIHAVLTLVTGIWVFVWIYKRKESKNETAHNQRLALFTRNCEKCGGPLAFSSSTDPAMNMEIFQ